MLFLYSFSAFGFQQVPFGFFKTSVAGPDPCFCLGTPAPGTVCNSGTIFLGTLSPGATSGSGTNKYMTTPGGCAYESGVTDSTSYALTDFTPVCSGGMDVVRKDWNNGTMVDIPGVTNYTTATGVGVSGSNTDNNYGSTNTTNIITSSAANAAAAYCDKLKYAGFTDWYLPNRYELNLFYINKTSIPGLQISQNTNYWSSSEGSSTNAWAQWMYDGYVTSNYKAVGLYVRCVRRY